MSYGRQGQGQQQKFSVCKYCQEEIIWKPDPTAKFQTREDGSPKNYPFSAVNSDERHYCPQASSAFDELKRKRDGGFGGGQSKQKRQIFCRSCNDEIRFDEAHRTDSGKWIPLNPDGSNHDCPVKRRQYEQQQQQD